MTSELVPDSSPGGAPAIEVEGLRKTYGSTVALAGVDFTVERGTVLGLLGPNGAGKTTVVRILTTLLRPDAGRARVAGLDVVEDAEVLRTRIGLAGQYAAVDANLTGRENLRMVGRLYHLPRAEVARRADALLERFELTDAANRPSKTYSGGMRRRLDLAASLVNDPEILFLDEPTTGLDPRSRLSLWQVIADLVRDGTTLLLTTQYLEEADRLADRIAVIDHGTLIAQGTADELKAQVGGTVVEVRVAPGQSEAAVAVLSGLGMGDPQVGGQGQVTLPAGDNVATVTDAATALQKAGLEVTEVALRRPTLDDVFLNLTGQSVEAAPDEGPDGPPRRGSERSVA